MSPLEITLIVIGIICIVVSCLLIDQKKEDTVETELGTVTEQILYNQLSEANANISAHINQLKNEVYEKTEDEMNRMSNEKIMAIHEYSDQVMGDIKKSHNEVLFLYQMLTEKEEDLKSALNEMQKIKRDVEHYCRNVYENLDDTQVVEAHTMEEKAPVHRNTAKKTQEKSKTKTTDTKNSNTENELESNEFANHMDEILKLSEQGCSVIEISKRLGLGQGEVKLVLDYNKR